jgi:polysaccharide pyruvyl transferase WcaK-like protein
MGSAAGRVGLFGNFGSGNLGNDGSLEAMLNFLRVSKPDAELMCICADPHKVQNEFGIPSIALRMEQPVNNIARILDRFRPIRWLRHLFRIFMKVRQFDLLITPGTGLLDDFSDTPSGMPASLFCWCLAARACGTKIAFVSVGAGPITKGLGRWLAKWAARMAHFRSYRDTISKEFMHSIGLDTRRDGIYPDIAFSLPSPHSSTASPLERMPAIVGLGVMAYYGWRGDRLKGADIYKNYRAGLVRFVMWLLDHGYRVRLLVGEEGDRHAIDDLLSVLASERPTYPRQNVIFDPAHSLRDLMRQIAGTQFVVATRYHNIVCALKLSRPCISIGYAAKNDVLMADMGLGEFCQHIEQLDIDRLTAQFTKLVINRAMYVQRMDEMNRIYRQRLAHQELILLEDILS